MKTSQWVIFILIQSFFSSSRLSSLASSTSDFLIIPDFIANSCKSLLAKSINVKEASIFDYTSDNYRYCNIPVRVTNVSSEKATYTVSFALTTTDKDGKPLVRNESIVVDDLADGATRDYAIFSSTGDGCALMRKSSNLVITKVVK